MFKVIITDKRDETILVSRNFKNNEDKAFKYFNLLKQDAMLRRNDYYDIDEEIKFSDIKLSLYKDDEELEYFTIR
ncbi:hypothetical protein IJE86_03800 [bacterium]|nr:hypothetical protein [bacterium]